MLYSLTINSKLTRQRIEKKLVIRHSFPFVVLFNTIELRHLPKSSPQCLPSLLRVRRRNNILTQLLEDDRRCLAASLYHPVLVRRAEKIQEPPILDQIVSYRPRHICSRQWVTRVLLLKGLGDRECIFQ